MPQTPIRVYVALVLTGILLALLDMNGILSSDSEPNECLAAPESVRA